MSEDLQLFTIPTAVSSDVRFKQGRLFLKDKQYEESIEMFSSLLQSCNTSYGEMSVESAVVHYEYGNALLLKEEENPSNDLLGNVDATASNDSKHVEDEDVDDEDEEAEGETEENPPQEDDEPEGDLQIAWEVLDVARCILEKESSAACKSFLSDVYMRLGDLMRFNSNVAASIEEYQKALTIRLSSCAPHDRMISDTHFSLAVAYVYNASEKDSGVDPEQEKMKALSHYKKSQESISSWIELFKDSGAEKEEELLDRREVHDMLQETIDSLTADLGQVTRQSSSSSSAASVPAPADGTTTIGFGTASISSSQLLPSSAAPIQTLQAKPKKRGALDEGSNGSKAKRT